MNKYTPLYPTEETFDKALLVAGMNTLGTAALFGAEGSVVHDLLVAGQTTAAGPLSPAVLDPEGAIAIRVAVIYRHLPSNTLGLFVQDFSVQLLRELEDIGRALQ